MSETSKESNYIKKKIAKAKKSKEEPKDTKQEKINELTALIQQVQAEFENYKKRTEREQKEFVKYASEEVIKNILPILDNFELALTNADKNNEFTKGIELIFAQLFEALEKQGLKRIEALNQKFDPYKHEALMQVEGKEPNIIVEVLQKGYTLNDKVIRHAKVKVTK